jgi:hypothetical protein
MKYLFALSAMFFLWALLDFIFMGHIEGDTFALLIGACCATLSYKVLGWLK